ncbi:MAG: aminodeoxychorismate/anthranilate synthase component II [Gammaproteobacteria bacterium]
MLLIIDNYDSFTYNLVHYFGRLGSTPTVVRNDAITLDEIHKLEPSAIILSPGPCTPNEAGICLALIERFAGIVPIFGVCLGLQCIAQYFGGAIVRAPHVMHGKLSNIYHNNSDVFSNLPNPLRATRYHSLIVEPKTIPAVLQITAWTQTPQGDLECIMGLRHRSHLISGVQFHPESIASEYGLEILQQFLHQIALICA